MKHPILFYCISLWCITLSASQNHTQTQELARIEQFFNQNHYETQLVQPLLQQIDSEVKKSPIAMAFSPTDHGHIAIGFDDNTLEIRNAKNTNNIVSTISFHEPTNFIAFGPWVNREDLILGQQYGTRSSLKLLNLPKGSDKSIGTLESSHIQHEPLTSAINHIIFEPNALSFAVLGENDNKTQFVIKKDSTQEWTKLSTENIDSLENIVISPLKNYYATFPTLYTLYITPSFSGKFDESKKIIIRTENPITSVTFSLNGTRIAVVTTETKKSKKRVYLYESSTGKYITKLNLPTQKNIISVHLNEDASEIALLHEDGTIDHITFDNPSSSSLKQLASNNEVLRTMLYNAIKQAQLHKSHTLSLAEYWQWNNLSSDQQNLLNKKLAVKLSWLQTGHQFIKSPYGLLTTALLILYFWAPKLNTYFS